MEKKQHFWTLLVIIWAAGISLVFFFCTSAKNARTFGVSYMTMNNPFYTIVHTSIVKEVESRSDSLMIRDPLLSVERQIEQIEEMIDADVDGLFINPIDSSSLQPVLEKAAAKGIPVVVIDSPVSESAGVKATITSDNYQAGVLCAQDMMQQLDAAKILLLEHSSTLSALQRIQGFKDTIADSPQYTIAAEIECMGQLEEAMPLTAEALENGLEVDVIMALNDPSALGALGALQSQNIDDVLVYGVDGTPDVKQKILSDACMQATAAQSPVKIGEAAAQTMYAILEHRDYEETQVLDVYLIDKNNAAASNPGGWQ